MRTNLPNGQSLHRFRPFMHRRGGQGRYCTQHPVLQPALHELGNILKEEERNQGSLGRNYDSFLQVYYKLTIMQLIINLWHNLHCRSSQYNLQVAHHSHVSNVSRNINMSVISLFSSNSSLVTANLPGSQM